MTPTGGHRLSLQSIEESVETIDPVFLNSPFYENEAINDRLACRLALKVETANPLRSFKGRGAEHFLAKATARGDDRELICASTGNFGQGMAYACRKRGRSLVVFADASANALKVQRIRDMGAEVKLMGVDFDQAKEFARNHAAERGAWMVEDGHEPEISEGAGSIAVEMTAITALDAIVVPLGNGALIGGIGRWFKAHSPSTKIIGVSATGADAMEKSWRTGQIVNRSSVDTIAEGIAVRVPVPAAVEDMWGLVDEVVLVDDQSIISAMRLVRDHAGLLTEPAGAAGVAAVASNVELYRDKSVATIIGGSNLTEEQRRLWLD